MRLREKELLELCGVAIEAVEKAGKLVHARFGQKVDFSRKKSGDTLSSQIVTKTDFESQELILRTLEPSIKKFDLGLLAEESHDDSSRFQKESFWCIDPLDGTLPFVEGRSGHAISIALVSRDGTPHLGVIYDSDEQNIYHAIKGMGAYRNKKVWQLNPVEPGPFKRIIHGGAVMNACWVLENAPACFYKEPKKEEGGGCLWDYAATTCLFKELGAWGSDMKGNILDLNKKNSLYMNQEGVLFASHAFVAQHILESR